MLCPNCSQEAYRSRMKSGIEKIASLIYLYQIGNTKLWYCPRCCSYYQKRLLKKYLE